MIDPLSLALSRRERELSVWHGMIRILPGAIDEEAAYQSLRKLAMDRGQKLGEVARSVIDVLALIE